MVDPTVKDTKHIKDQSHIKDQNTQVQRDLQIINW